MHRGRGAPAHGGRLRTYRAVALLARTADEGMSLALILLALHRTGHAAEGAFVLTAWMAPHVAAAPLAGALLARTGRPRLLHAAALTGFAATIALLGAGLGRLPLPAVLAIAAAGGACGPVVSGGLSSLLPGLVPNEALGRAYGLDAAVYNAASVAAPAAVGTVAAARTPAWALGALAAAAGTAAVLALRLPAAPAPLAKGRRRPTALRADLTAGLYTVLRVPELRAITAATTCAFLGLGGLGACAVLLASDRGDADGGGLLMTAFAAGALAGSLAQARLRPGTPAPRLASRCLLGLGTSLTAAAVVGHWPLCVALFAVAGACEGPLLTATLRVRADHAPPELRPQVFTTGAGLKISAAACGTALVGTGSQHLSPATLLLYVAGTQLAAVPLARLARRRDPRG